MASINRKQLFGLAIALALVFLAAELFFRPPIHDVHLPGGRSVAMTVYQAPLDSRAPRRFFWTAAAPSESLAAIRCMSWAGQPPPPCTSDDIAIAFPGLTQEQHTLYYVWRGCPLSDYVQGLNVEFLAAGRSLIFHCSRSWGWFPDDDRVYHGGQDPGNALFVIATTQLVAGTIQIVEDDRVEHLLGDTSTQRDLATATIS